jgi:hypothetical protein
LVKKLKTTKPFPHLHQTIPLYLTPLTIIYYFEYVVRVASALPNRATNIYQQLNGGNYQHPNHNWICGFRRTISLSSKSIDRREIISFCERAGVSQTKQNKTSIADRFIRSTLRIRLWHHQQISDLTSKKPKASITFGASEAIASSSKCIDSSPCT